MRNLGLILFWSICIEQDESAGTYVNRSARFFYRPRSRLGPHVSGQRLAVSTTETWLAADILQLSQQRPRRVTL
jgi:hypothetical protein